MDLAIESGLNQRLKNLTELRQVEFRLAEFRLVVPMRP
tara:strand:+ start:1509 stop:1622 length:114 start_codon:yes stop_codon:yes gene_type:complete